MTDMSASSFQLPMCMKAPEIFRINEYFNRQLISSTGISAGGTSSRNIHYHFLTRAYTNNTKCRAVQEVKES